MFCSLPSARLEALGKEGVTADNGHDCRFSLPKAALALGKGFAERPTKDAPQRSLCQVFFVGSPLPSVALGSLCRVQIGLCRASQALGKPVVCGSELSSLHLQLAYVFFEPHVFVHRLIRQVKMAP